MVVVKTELDTTGGMSLFPNLGTSGSCLVDLQVHVPASRNTSLWKAGIFFNRSAAIHALAPCRMRNRRVAFYCKRGDPPFPCAREVHTHTGTLPSPEIPLSDVLGILLSRFTESGMKRWFYKRGVARQERNAPGYRADPSSLQNKGQGEGYEAYQIIRAHSINKQKPQSRTIKQHPCGSHAVTPRWLDMVCAVRPHDKEFDRRHVQGAERDIDDVFSDFAAVRSLRH